MNVKIFVSHRIDLNSVAVENDVFFPVRCGAVFDKRPAPDMAGDDTGDNISNKRESYCELTVQYWAWKNVQADYYGLCHYRRYLSFLPEDKKRLNEWSNYIVPRLDEDAIHQHQLDDEKGIKGFVANYDVVTMCPVELEKVHRASAYEQYEKDGVRLHIRDLDIMLDIIRERHPDYAEAAEKYIFGKKQYIGNIFIMRKELFFSYSQWLFDILAEFDKRVDMSDYSVEAYRTPGHLGERLFGIYYTWLQMQGGYRLAELPLLCFSDTAPYTTVQPAFGKNCVPIVMSSSQEYAKFCAITLQSLKDCAEPQNNYDIFILQRNIRADTQRRIQKIFEGLPNFSVRFINVKSYIERYNLYESPTISIETYFRLIIPELLGCFDKLLYLDGDLIIKRDVAQLYHTDIGDNWLGAVLDICEAGVTNGYDINSAQYVKDRMQLRTIWKQFNAGVLVLNNRAFCENFTTRYLLEFAEAGNFRFQDQDALNILCEEHIFWLDPRWNLFADPVDSYRGWVEQYAPRLAYQAFREAAKDPWIIHYAGNEKPWIYPEFEWADEFWSVAAKTAFYPDVLASGRTVAAPQPAAQAQGPRVVYSPISQKSRLRSLADILLPLGSKRRERLKALVPGLTNRIVES